MKNWFYKDPLGSIFEYQNIDNFKKENIGFIYIITNIASNKIYVGRKSLYSNINKKLTKKEISEQSGPGRKPTKKLVTSESNWKAYCGSSKELIKDIKELGEDLFTREILHICNTKKQLTFYEIQYQIMYKVLEVDSYNDNILGKFYRKDLV